MQTRGIKLDHRSVNIVMTACNKGEQWALMLKLFEQMPTLTANSFVPTGASYTLAINAACRLKNATKAIEVRL
jgi:pentatricopeptide repeat protein